MSDESRRRPFVHELLVIGIWILGTFLTFVWLDPAGTSIPYALFSLVAGMIGGTVVAILAFFCMAVYLRVFVGIDVTESQPTLTALAISFVLTLVVTYVLYEPTVAVIDSLQPGETGDHPLNKGQRAALFMTAAIAGLVSEAACLPLLRVLGVDAVESDASNDE